MNISGLSLSELKALLSKVESELSHIDSEGAICNNIAKSFTGNKALTIEYNKKIKQDIQIQLDILEFMNNGGHIQFTKASNKLNNKAVKGAKSGLKLYRKFAV
jgi:hypothetical protein